MSYFPAIEQAIVDLERALEDLKACVHNEHEATLKAKEVARSKPSIDLEADSGEEGNPIDVNSDDEEEKF